MGFPGGSACNTDLGTYIYIYVCVCVCVCNKTESLCCIPETNATL